MQLTVTKKQNNSDMCIVCGVKSDASLKAGFYELENGYIASIVTPLDIHQSYPNRMHGGMISALLDEVLGRAIQIGNPDAWAVTGELTVKFRKPTPLNKPLIAVAKITRDTPRFYIAEGFIECDGVLLAEAKGTYFKAGIDAICDGFLDGNSWFFVPDETPVTQIEVANMKFFENK